MPRRAAAPSDTLTSVTAPSLADDGLSLTRRMPRRDDPGTITNWLEGTVGSPVLPPASSIAGAVSESEVYTGSFFDDGADLRRPSPFQTVPGFGSVDRRFYSGGKPTKKKHEEEWTVEKERALAGDMFRSLAKLKSVARVEVRDAREVDGRKARRKRDKSKVGAVEDDGRVRIMKPLRWGTFIIEGKDGRVVIVDEQGEYDSGKVDEREELARREREYEERVTRRKERERERAKREAEKKAKKEARRLRKLEEEKELERKRAKAKDDQRRDKHRQRRGRSPPSRPLTPISDDGLSEDDAPEVASPTKFFMTGARSGWTPSAISTAKPHEIPTTPTKLVSTPASVRQPSSTKSKLSMRSLIAATAHSTITSMTKSDNTHEEKHTVTLEASATRLPSSAASLRYSDATTSTRPSVTSRSPRTQVSAAGSERPARKPKGKESYETHSKANSFKSRRDGGGKYSPQRQSTHVSSLSRSSINPFTMWGETVEAHSSREPSKRGRSRGRSRSSARHARTIRPDTPSRSLSRRATSRARSRNSSRKRQIEDSDFEYIIKHTVSRPSTRASNTSIAAWIGESFPDTESLKRSRNQPQRTRQADGARAPSTILPQSEASAVTPYSWRRHVEELSDHSTIGSHRSVSHVSPISSNDRGSDGESIPLPATDALSFKSHSTYRAPTLQDASDEENGTQDWESPWGAEPSRAKKKSGPRTSEAGSAKWSGKTGWAGDVVAEGSGAGSVKWEGGDGGEDVSRWRDKSGFEEDNETWLNKEVGGVRYREAEWRGEPSAGSWRDV